MEPSPQLAPRSDELAREVLAAFATGRQITPFSERFAGFDMDAAYAVSEEIRRLRGGRRERAVGRKIGFTNRTIWSEYGVHAPIWSYVYDTTVHTLPPFDAIFRLRPFLEPRIEPEIVFGLARAPEPGMDERALLSCMGWIAHGYEIVQSLFPRWKFTAPDTVAALGLHGALLLGPQRRLEETEAEMWLDALPAFEIALVRNDSVMDRGRSANVLGGPLSALRHLVDGLANDPRHPPLGPGEMISTGTLTRALPVRPGETWRTALTGIPIDGLRVTLQ
jgi:2-oxo-3-hexenedioate decarboxylase